jgi:hypothetical protein
VLTTGCWPINVAEQCILPREVPHPKPLLMITNSQPTWSRDRKRYGKLTQVQDKCNQFKAHYMTAHTGRRLTWQTNMGNADVKGYAHTHNTRTLALSRAHTHTHTHTCTHTHTQTHTCTHTHTHHTGTSVEASGGTSSQSAGLLLFAYL